jgi:hypothetical protein
MTHNRDLLCPDCGHHLHRPNPGPCQWHDCQCGHEGAVVTQKRKSVPEEVIRDVLALVIHHTLSHDSDPADLVIAGEFLKAMRNEGDERIAVLYERWRDEIVAVR